jgi:glycosyltransferase involved in cell wall biosynthesis
VLQASVIICAHNPRSDYFGRVLASLRDQTLPLDNWELLIIDNASKMPLASDWHISWHPTGRHLVESELGVAEARRRGIREARADLIVFVDDDNVLDKSYLTQAVGIGRDWPLLGAWGSGSIQADFEVRPSESVMEFSHYLALRETASPQWSNVASCVQAMPWGAGLCVRKAVAVGYCQLCERSSIQITGRVGSATLSGEDREIALSCCAQGFGFGIFPDLKIIHLIPRHRVSEDYIVRLVEGTTLSDLLLDYKWLNIIPASPLRVRVLLSVLKTLLLHSGIDRRMRFASVRALAKANRIIDADLKKRLMHERPAHLNVVYKR